MDRSSTCSERYACNRNISIPIAIDSEGGTRDFGLIGDFDIVESAERQSSFLWQVSGERFGDIDFLREGQVNYKRFLHLIRLHPGSTLHLITA